MILFYYIVFPGFLFLIVVGFMAAWLDRKVTARIHYRVGPPLLQSFFDVFKLLGKEIIVPKNSSKFLFLFAPIIAFAVTLLVSVNVFLAFFGIKTNLIGSDILSATYLLYIPTLFIALGAMASRNPLSSVGASREMKLFLSYELPYILCITAVIVKLNHNGNSFKLIDIVSAQSKVSFAANASGIISLIVLTVCIHAKLSIVPFDIPEAETEIMEGTFVEYSGYPFAMFKITKMILLFTLPSFVILLTLGKPIKADISILWFALKYIGILVFMILLKNTNPRVRSDQALKFFWFYLSVPASAAVILALIGY